MKKQIMEDRIALMLRTAKVEFVREYKFHPTRKWRADFSIPEAKVLLEYEGGIFSGGAHTRGVHYSSDCQKYNAAVILGWRVLRYTAKELGVKNGVFRILDDLKQMGVAI